ncbi:MAG TPA: radical SAM protein [Spirochaetota bacterium]|nr:radical SAM protein [Spirochaetota bacterium]HOS40249.1 radical SAM protein [Spirochaetota bacterium]HPI22328.1 radical SAM protein [Spirochaetota bacterium]HPU86820.1 radical SAM protein [Spirochaetota bacterium]
MKASSGPRLIFWELTKRCNLRCRHCRAEADDAAFSGELPTGAITGIIDDIAAFAKPIMVLTGGEPLFRDDIFAIARHARGRGLRTALATNGTLIDEAAARAIRDAGIMRVSISIDGSTADSHDGFRGIPGSFELALRGAERLAAAGVEFQFNTTVTRRNTAELEEILRLAEDRGAAALHLFMLVPVGCGVEIADTDMISPDEYERILNWFYDRSRETALEFKATCAPHYYRIVRQRAKAEGRSVAFETNGMAAMTRGCLAGTGVCFISHRGDVQPCGYLPLVAGNVTQTRFADIWNDSPLLVGLRDLSNLTGKCGACEYRGVCAGCRARAFHATGDHFAEEPYCVYVPQRRQRHGL